MMIVRCACGAFVLLRRSAAKDRKRVYFPCPACHKRGEAVEVRAWPAVVSLMVEPVRLEEEIPS